MRKSFNGHFHDDGHGRCTFKKHDQNQLAKKLVKAEAMVVELQEENIVIKDSYKTQNKTCFH
jgi:hypothetical protein